MAQVRWSLTAGYDLQDIEAFIARDSVLHAITFLDRIVESTETILATPHIGRIVPEFSRPDLREIIFRNYRIVYPPTKRRGLHSTGRTWVARPASPGPSRTVGSRKLTNGRWTIALPSYIGGVW